MMKSVCGVRTSLTKKNIFHYQHHDSSLLFLIHVFSFQPAISSIPSNKIRFPESSEPYFIKQTIGNACGTIAILHALGNSLPSNGDPSSSTIWSKLFWVERNDAQNIYIWGGE
jgi:hypothetical protein